MNRRGQAWLAFALGVGALTLFLLVMFDVAGAGSLMGLPVIDTLVVVAPPAMALAAIMIARRLRDTTSVTPRLVASSAQTVESDAKGDAREERTSANIAALVGLVAAIVFFGCVALWVLSWIVPL